MASEYAPELPSMTFFMKMSRSMLLMCWRRFAMLSTLSLRSRSSLMPAATRSSVELSSCELMGLSR